MIRMNKEKYAHYLASELAKKPTKKNVELVTKKLMETKNNDGEYISEEIVFEIEELIGNELGEINLITEQFDNQEQITVMQKMHQLIDQANASKTSVSSSQSVSNKDGGKK